MAYDRVVDSAELDTKLTSVADAIRSKTGKTEGLTLEQMPGEIEGIETGGVSEQEILDCVFTRTWPSGDIVINSTKMPYNEKTLAYNSLITSIHCPNLIVAPGYAFQGCKSLKTFTAPELDNTGSQFLSESIIEQAYFPKLKTLGAWGFNSCYKLEYIRCPVLTNFGGGSFGVIESCTKLKVVDVLGGGSFHSNTFQKCYVFDTLILRNEQTITANSGAFNNTPFKGYNGLVGYCYVPSALISEYQQATNWSALYEAGTCIFRALEDYTIDGTTTGEMDWAKIEGGTA